MFSFKIKVSCRGYRVFTEFFPLAKKRDWDGARVCAFEGDARGKSKTDDPNAVARYFKGQGDISKPFFALFMQHSAAAIKREIEEMSVPFHACSTLLKNTRSNCAGYAKKKTNTRLTLFPKSSAPALLRHSTMKQAFSKRPNLPAPLPQISTA